MTTPPPGGGGESPQLTPPTTTGGRIQPGPSRSTITLLGVDKDPKAPLFIAYHNIQQLQAATSAMTLSTPRATTPLPQRTIRQGQRRGWTQVQATNATKRRRKASKPKLNLLATVRQPASTANSFSVLQEVPLGANHPIMSEPGRPGPSYAQIRAPSVPCQPSAAASFATHEGSQCTDPTQPSAALETAQSQTSAQGNKPEAMNIDASEAAASSQEAPVSRRKIPPICVFDKTNYLTHVKYLKSKLTGELSVTNSRDCLRYHASSIEDYNIILNYFQREQKAEYYTHQLPTNRQLKVVIRNLPECITVADVEEELKSMHFSPSNVHQFTKKDQATGQITALPVFSLTLPKDDYSHQIYSVRYLCNVRVRIEAYKNRAGPAQCHQCQRYGHTKSFCNMKPRCVKCGESHESKACPLNPEAPAKCVNCGQNHPASWKGCAVFTKIVEDKETAAAARAARVRYFAEQRRVGPDLSFANMASSFPPMAPPRAPFANMMPNAPLRGPHSQQPGAPSGAPQPGPTQANNTPLDSNWGLGDLFQLARVLDVPRIMNIARYYVPLLQNAQDTFTKLELIYNAVMCYLA